MFFDSISQISGGGPEIKLPEWPTQWHGFYSSLQLVTT